MPKKTRSQTDNQKAEFSTASPEASADKAAPRRTSAIVRKTKPGVKKSLNKRSPGSGQRVPAALPGDPADEEIRLRAYFISERRQRLALPGDASSDWSEAKRQLLSESGPVEKTL